MCADENNKPNELSDLEINYRSGSLNAESNISSTDRHKTGYSLISLSLLEYGVIIQGVFILGYQNSTVDAANVARPTRYAQRV